MSDNIKVFHKRMERLQAWEIVLNDIHDYSEKVDEKDCIDLLLVTNILQRHLEGILNNGG